MGACSQWQGVDGHSVWVRQGFSKFQGQQATREQSHGVFPLQRHECVVLQRAYCHVFIKHCLFCICLMQAATWLWQLAGSTPSARDEAFKGGIIEVSATIAPPLFKKKGYKLIKGCHKRTPHAPQPTLTQTWRGEALG